MAENKAREILWPSDSNILVRFVWLYVGQGSSTIILIKDGETYKVLLADINLDKENGGINVPALMTDLLEDKSLDVFINSHPHDDHLRGIVELSEEIEINEIWHSGHKPGRKHDDAYKDLMEVVDKVKDGGHEIILKGSKEQILIGEASYYILAPAKYVSDDISDEDPDTRYRRIHEQCAVLKFGIEQTWCMIPGDADRDAFEKHITKYHKERLKSIVLTASHHGSRSFFRYDEEDDPYLDALNEIDPDYVVISAPKKEESKHGHPNDDAVKMYQDKVDDANNVLHTGDKRYCYLCDIYDDGSYSGIYDDKGELVEKYPIKDNKNRITPIPVTHHTRVDDRGMGAI